MIEMHHVSKIYYPARVVALQDINLFIEKGEFVFIVGPSGAGKSTLTKLIYREDVPSEGRVFVLGKDITRLRRREIPFLRRKIGVVFQDFKLLPDRTVYDNVAFALRVIEASPREIRKRVPAVLDLVGLLDRARNLPGQLSGGEQQRVALARAIANNPPIVIADEPTGNLDPQTSWEIVCLLKEINRFGTTVIMATHDEKIVDAMQKRVIALERGHIVRDDERGVYAHEA